MNIDLSEVSPQEHEGPILHLGKKLLPIDEYSSNTGLSRGLLEQYGRIGIIQIRKYKGRTFVVDVPSQLRFNNAETKAVEDMLSLRNKALQTKKLTELVARMTSSPTVEEALPEQIPDLELFKTSADSSAPTTKMVTLGQTGFERLFAKIQISQLRQVFAAFAITFLAVTAYASFWLLITNNTHAGIFAKAHTSIQEIVNESGRTGREIDVVQNQLNNSFSQAKIMHTDIAVAMGELETTRQSNKEAVQKLDEQFAKLKLLK